MHDNTRHMKGCEVCVVDTRDTTAGGAVRALQPRGAFWVVADGCSHPVLVVNCSRSVMLTAASVSAVEEHSQVRSDITSGTGH